MDSEFNKRRRSKDGLHSCCKVCERQYRRANRKHITDYIREWREKNPEKAKAIAARADANRKNRKLIVDPEKAVAHRKARTAKECGDLAPQPCEVCGSEKAQMHHDDYSKPLEVRWFCARHHARHEGRHGLERIEQILGEES
jgi:hypothetical protein